MIDLGKSLKESTLTPASYAPSNKAKNMQHLVITVNDNLLLLSLGEANDLDSKIEAKALLKSEEFKKIVSVQYPNASLELRAKYGYDIDWKDAENAIAKSKAGKVELDDEQGDLQWIVFGENSLAIATALCTSKEVQKIAI